MKTLIAIFCSFAVVVFTHAAPAHAGLLEPYIQPHLKKFPECHDTKVLGEIVKRFNKAEEEFYHRNIYLADITEVRENTLVPANRSRQIPRRYCRAHAQLSNGRHPALLYLIEGGQGFAGTGFHVAFCINGLDSQRFFNGSCRSLNH